jgi:hypothetical protein
VAIPGSETTVVATTAGDTVEFSNEFYVSTSDNLPLVFLQNTTGADNIIDNFTVTVKKIS